MGYRKEICRGERGKRLQRTAASAMLVMCMLCGSAAWAAALGAGAALLCAEEAQAAEAGAYLVTVTPSYTDPETGRIEDPGNNEAIGQGMTQKLCGSQGLLEVDGAGNQYLTVRYYLSQFVSDVSFEERSGGSYTACSYERMQTKAPVDGAANLDDKYGYTDYRIPIRSLDSVFRGKAYIEPMGRSVVYFFQASGPVSGSGDFVTSVRTEDEAEPAAQAEEIHIQEEERAERDERLETDWYDEPVQEDNGSGGLSAQREETGRSGVGASGSLDDGANGSGDADAPVTGIPAKPSEAAGAGASAAARTSAASGTGSGSSSGGLTEDYRLETSYDLSSVPLKEARKLTEPMLEAAAGITETVGELPKLTGVGGSRSSETRQGADKTIMLVLLAVSAVLIIRLAVSFLVPRGGAGAQGAAKASGREPASLGTGPSEAGTGAGQDEIERRRNGR